MKLPNNLKQAYDDTMSGLDIVTSDSSSVKTSVFIKSMVIPTVTLFLVILSFTWAGNFFSGDQKKATGQDKSTIDTTSNIQESNIILETKFDKNYSKLKTNNEELMFRLDSLEKRYRDLFKLNDEGSKTNSKQDQPPGTNSILNPLPSLNKIKSSMENNGANNKPELLNNSKLYKSKIETTLKEANNYLQKENYNAVIHDKIHIKLRRFYNDVSGLSENQNTSLKKAISEMDTFKIVSKEKNAKDSINVLQQYLTISDSMNNIARLKEQILRKIIQIEEKVGSKQLTLSEHQVLLGEFNKLKSSSLLTLKQKSGIDSSITQLNQSYLNQLMKQVNDSIKITKLKEAIQLIREARISNDQFSKVQNKILDGIEQKIQDIRNTTKTHLVRPRQTLYFLSTQYNVTQDQIRALNKKEFRNTTTLYAGEVYFIR